MVTDFRLGPIVHNLEFEPERSHPLKKRRFKCQKDKADLLPSVLSPYNYFMIYMYNPSSSKKYKIIAATGKKCAHFSCWSLTLLSAEK